MIQNTPKRVSPNPNPYPLTLPLVNKYFSRSLNMKYSQKLGDESTTFFDKVEMEPYSNFVYTEKRKGVIRFSTPVILEHLFIRQHINTKNKDTKFIYEIQTFQGNLPIEKLEKSIKTTTNL